MKAGKLRTKVIIKSLTTVKNADFTNSEVYAPLMTVYGNVVWLRGRSYFENYQFLYEIKGRVFTRYRNDIELQYRLELDGVDYEIESISPVDNKKKEMEIVFKVVEA